MKLQKYDDQYSYFEIDTAKYNKLNSVQRQFAERVHGQGANFDENMKMFRDAKIKNTGIYVLNPEYVKANVNEEHRAFARASWLYGFGYDSLFSAVDRDVGGMYVGGMYVGGRYVGGM